MLSSVVKKTGWSWLMAAQNNSGCRPVAANAQFCVFLRLEHSIHGYQSRRFGVSNCILVLNVNYFVLFAYILKNTNTKYARNIASMGINQDVLV